MIRVKYIQEFLWAVEGSVGSVQFQIVPCSAYTSSQGLQVPSNVASANYRVLICCICHFQSLFFVYFGFLCLQVSSVSKKASVYNAGDPGSIPGLGRSPREGNGNPLQYHCLENPMDRGAWQATVHWGCKESDTTELLHFHFQHLTSALAQGGKGGHLFWFTCLIVLQGRRNTANQCHWHMWGVLTVSGPHWICHRSRHVFFPSLHCSGSRLLCRGTV